MTQTCPHLLAWSGSFIPSWSRMKACLWAADSPGSYLGKFAFRVRQITSCEVLINLHHSHGSAPHKGKIIRDNFAKNTFISFWKCLRTDTSKWLSDQYRNCISSTEVTDRVVQWLGSFIMEVVIPVSRLGFDLDECQPSCSTEGCRKSSMVDSSIFQHFLDVTVHLIHHTLKCGTLCVDWCPELLILGYNWNVVSMHIPHFIFNDHAAILGIFSNCQHSWLE